ncbi:MAG: aminodeoxychorismate/anthranilate synthase component II [Acidimicrobiales bacterium]|nr:aminodeoxychorismate/anthranilate synthase component II [Acidimicrobiales bacterium]
MAPRILVIDNYDSFVYILVQYLGELGAEPVVVRNDHYGVDELVDMAPDGLLVSPGPGRPEDAGVSKGAIEAFAGSVPVLGVCLGHQSIGEVYGGTVVGAPELMHGKTSEVEHEGVGVFESLPSPVRTTRYHSLIVRAEDLPDDLEVTATTADGVIMGMRHRSVDVEGVQFHPESILTVGGKTMVANFIGRCRP